MNAMSLAMQIDNASATWREYRKPALVDTGQHTLLASVQHGWRRIPSAVADREISVPCLALHFGGVFVFCVLCFETGLVGSEKRGCMKMKCLTNQIQSKFEETISC